MLQLKKKILIGTLSLVFEKLVSNNDRANLDVNHLVAIAHETYSELLSMFSYQTLPIPSPSSFCAEFPITWDERNLDFKNCEKYTGLT